MPNRLSYPVISTQDIFNRQPQQLESRLQISKNSPMWQLEQEEQEAFCCIEEWGPPSAFANHSSDPGTNAQGLSHKTSHLQMGLNGDNQKRCFRLPELGSWLPPASGPICRTPCVSPPTLCPSSLLTPAFLLPSFFAWRKGSIWESGS